MSAENNPLAWHSLAPVEVEAIAHQEHEARELFLRLVGSVAYDNADALPVAHELRAAFEQYSTSWLAGQAALRGVSAEAPAPVDSRGAAIRGLREAAGLTQRQLADLLAEVSQPTLSRAENGRASGPAIAEILQQMRELGIGS